MFSALLLLVLSSRNIQHVTCSGYPLMLNTQYILFALIQLFLFACNYIQGGVFKSFSLLIASFCLSYGPSLCTFLRAQRNKHAISKDPRSSWRGYLKFITGDELPEVFSLAHGPPSLLTRLFSPGYIILKLPFLSRSFI